MYKPHAPHITSKDSEHSPNFRNVDTDGNFGGDPIALSRDDFASVDFGVSAGFTLNFNALSAGTRYNLGVVQLAKSETAGSMLGDARNSLAQVFLSYRIR